MSTPKNHHFVSKVHIKNFFNVNEARIYVYDKLKKNQFYKTTTKSLFSEEGSNSRFVNGKVDFNSLEKDLKDNFEDDFSEHTDVIIQFTRDRELTSEVENALRYLVRYGVISEMRTPRHKKEIDDSFFNGLGEIMRNAVPKLRAEFEEMVNYREKVKYSNSLNYSDVADEILSLMGDLIFQILIARNDSDFFILPDFAATTERAKINEYFNPNVREIAFVGLPLTSKVYVQLFSQKLFKNQPLPSSIVRYCESEEISFLNKASLINCSDKVACENEEYLKKIVTEFEI